MMPKNEDGIYNYTEGTGQDIKRFLASASVELSFPPSDEYIALEFHMAHYYMSHGDLGNAIRVAEQARIDMLSSGVESDSAEMLPFYVLLQTVYNFRDIRPADKAGEEPYLREYKRIADGYGMLTENIRKTATITSDPMLSQYINAEFDDRTIQDKAADTNRDLKTDLTADIRALKKKEQVAQYFNIGLQFLNSGRMAISSEQRDLIELQTAAVHLAIARMFLGQPDHKNGVIHAERAKAILLKHYDIKDPAMLKCYQFLVEVYATTDPKASSDDQLRYVTAVDKFAVLIAEIHKLQDGKPPRPTF